MKRICLIAASILAPLALAAAQPDAQRAERYETTLGHTGIADGTAPAITGKGAVLATLNGQVLTIDGQMSGLNAPATDARLMQGAGIGIPGGPMPKADLILDKSGKISGTVKLSREQLAALRAGNLYVQVNSAKSPAPAGHLWGWLLPFHAKAGEDEPQLGGWFLPQGAGLTAHPRDAKK